MDFLSTLHNYSLYIVLSLFLSFLSLCLYWWRVPLIITQGYFNGFCSSNHIYHITDRKIPSTLTTVWDLSWQYPDSLSVLSLWLCVTLTERPHQELANRDRNPPEYLLSFLCLFLSIQTGSLDGGKTKSCRFMLVYCILLVSKHTITSFL